MTEILNWGEDITNGHTEQKEDSQSHKTTKTSKRNTSSTTPQKPPDLANQVENDFLAAKKRWLNRKPHLVPQLYADHIELFLALIEPEYNKEVQATVVGLSLGEEPNDTFLVAKSRVKFHWQLTDDYQDTVDGLNEHNPFAIKAMYGTVQDNMNVLATKNARGANPCIAINKIEGSRRSNENVVTARAVWLEDDVVRKLPRTPTSEDPLPVAPSFVVESSRGKFHYYWLTNTTDLHRWRRIQEEVMTDRFGSDSGANGLNRAMRVPGFWHRKKKPFPTHICHMTSSTGYAVVAQPSEEFIETSRRVRGGKAEFAFTPVQASEVKTYAWEEIESYFGQFLPEKAPTGNVFSDQVNFFNPIEAIDRVFGSEDFHGSLHALCMHFANYQQDPEYVAHVVQGLMCRIPESQRDGRWNARFNDIQRSATAAVNKKCGELAAETLVSSMDITTDHTKDAVSLHSIDWHMPFPDLRGACEPLDMLLSDFEASLAEPIRSFNFATIMSFFSVALQNIPLMPALNLRTANGCHLMLSPSASGKDLNISQPLKQLALQILKSGFLPDSNIHTKWVLSGISSGGEITSLSAFHAWASNPRRERGAIWINTECTSLLGKMSAENTNVSNLTEVVINIQDGEPIIAVTKAKSRESENNTPEDLKEAYSVLFAAQPASIKKYMTPELLYKGLIGRFDYYISDRPVTTEAKPTLSRQTLRPYFFKEETIAFLAWMLLRCGDYAEQKETVEKRHVGVIYEDDEDDPLAYNYVAPLEDGPRRARHVKWELECAAKYQMEDPQFNTFLSRVPMSTERWLTILATVQHLWECYKTNSVPFTEPVKVTDKLLDAVIKLGEYQYKVRMDRIWALIGKTRGLDDRTMSVLEGIKNCDSNPQKWFKHITPNLRPQYEYLFHNERFIPMAAVSRLMAYDANVLSKDLPLVFQVLQQFGYIEYVAVKQMNVNVSDKPAKNVVRLTSQGRL